MAEEDAAPPTGTEQAQQQQQSEKSASNEAAGLSRRRFLAAGTGAAAAAALLPRGRAFGGQAQRRTAATPAYYESFSEPHVEYSRDGVLRTTLRVIEADVPVREDAGVRVERTRCYNGMVPGPTLKIRAGEELRIRLINELPAGAHCGNEQVNQPHCFNTTNIHTHGLHVSPLAPSDNSFLKIEPQTEYEYCFRVPEFHPAGTFWYHAHVHGSTALQVMNGMAGALIIEEPEEQRLVPEGRDLVWMMQEIVGGAAEKVYTCDHPHVAYTVNGRFQPTLRLRPGEIQRWRFINATATPGGFANLQLHGDDRSQHEMLLVAVDGYPLRRMQRRTEYILPPGGRADFLVQLPRSGRYRMMKLRFQGQARDQALAQIEVGGRPLSVQLPRRLPPSSPFLNPITDDEISNRRTVRFQVCPDQARGDVCRRFPHAGLCSGLKGDEMVRNAFLINDKPYAPERIDHSIKLGTAEEWEVVNESGAEHPFHIHVNHFQVVQEGVPPEEWVWQDTVSLPAEGSVRIRSRFRNYHGRYLLHCHILLHSDLGMMQNVEVAGNGLQPCKPA
ncbi:MAG TPA: multicopper oxidase domain-containing protein [Pyrinomonadaceae bacterium]|jgi:FtsP/CotA-like multicopper oxidase with cupredoxin domain